MGANVNKWRIFLAGGSFQILVEGTFGSGIKKTSSEYQQENELKDDGALSNQVEKHIKI